MRTIALASAYDPIFPVESTSSRHGLSPAFYRGLVELTSIWLFACAAKLQISKPYASYSIAIERQSLGWRVDTAGRCTILQLRTSEKTKHRLAAIVLMGGTCGRRSR